MKFPKRSKTHIVEAESWKLLERLAPKEWIVREVTERDYGIDGYVELCNEDGSITGDLMSLQLKGTARKLSWKKSDKLDIAFSPRIKSTTANYWLGLPVPVFLFMADLQADTVYYIPVKEQLRNQYQKLHGKDPIKLTLYKDLNLNAEVGRFLLTWFYARERAHDQFVFHITNLLNHVDIFGDFIFANQNRDSFMEVETEQHLQFRALYESCRYAAIYLEKEWKVESLSALYTRDRENWKDDFAYLHEETLDYALQKIEKIFPRLIRKALKLVTDTQFSYWVNHDPVFFNLCNRGDLLSRISQFEKRAGLLSPKGRGIGVKSWNI